MAEKKTVTLYAPDGTAVEVSEERAKTLKSRGYGTSKPKSSDSGTTSK